MWFLLLTNPLVYNPWTLSGLSLSQHLNRSFIILTRIDLIMSIFLSVHNKNLRVNTTQFWFFFFFFGLFRAVLSSYGYFQARDRIGAVCSRWPLPQPQQSWSPATSVTYTTTHGNTGSLTHWVRPGIGNCLLMVTSQIRFHWGTRGTPQLRFFQITFSQSSCCSSVVMKPTTIL